MRRALAFLLLASAVTGCPAKKDGGGDPAGDCVPGDTQSCYEGPGGTEGVGICAAGVSTCGADRTWGACAGAVLPAADVCGNGLNDDCVANADDVADLSRYEFPGNTVDDDCDGELDESATCDIALGSNSTDALDYAKGVDMCAITTTSATGTFGVTSASFSLVDGSGSPDVAQKSIRSIFGSAVDPRRGDSLIVLSTGVASYIGATNPNYAAPQTGTAHSTTSAFPADWLSANAGVPPVRSTCPALSGTSANDPILYTLQLRAPSNANGIAFDAYYFTTEFPEFVCSTFADVFVALLDSTATTNPADKNIARTPTIPTVSSALAHGDTGYFQQCLNGATGCGSTGVAATISTCVASSGLVQTGFDIADAGCGGGDQSGGATGWQTYAGNVTPGDLVTLRFALWDTSDGAYDATVLIDNVHWLEDAVTTPGIQ